MAKVVRINHVAFAVKNMDEAIQSAVENLGGELMLKFECIDQKYKGACIQLGESIISVLEATDETSFVAKHIEARGVGVQHIGLEIDNLEEYVRQLELKGVRVDKANMKDEDFPEALVGPKVGNGVVLQLMQWKGGHFDVSPEGKERLMRKYAEAPNLRVIG
ncbi:MAG: VOC family protein [Desulfobacterales bacterium]|nr:VOC family protein [Desulfobacterales bacterium]